MLQYGNVNEQVALVADQIASIPELQDGFDAIGFSQGIKEFNFNDELLMHVGLGT